MLGAAALTAAAGLGWAVAETRMFTVRAHTVPVLAPGSAPLRVLHLSDLHLTPWQQLKQRWVRSLLELAPDLVVSTGDNLAHPEAVPAVRRALGGLLELPGVFVLGSNDYYAPRAKNPARYLLPDARRSSEEDTPRPLPTDRLVDLLGSGGWQDLTNRRATVTVAGRTVTAVGVDDPHLDRDRFPHRPAQPDDGGAAVHLGVSHAPYTRVLDQLAGDSCDLILAGHTHGGQLRVPGYGALVTNCDLDTGRARGLHGWPGPRPDAPGGQDSTWLNVSAGLGTSPYTPVRFACRPEVSLLELVARS